MPARRVVLDHELMHHRFAASEKDAYKMQLLSARRILAEGYDGRALTDTEITEVRDLEIHAKTTLEYLGDPKIPGWKKTSLYMLIAGSRGWL